MPKRILDSLFFQSRLPSVIWVYSCCLRLHAGICFPLKLDSTSGPYVFAIRLKLSQVIQSCPTLCDPVDCSPPSSSVHGTFQAGILEWVAISFSRGSSQLRDWTWVSCITGGCFTLWAITSLLNGMSETSGNDCVGVNYVETLRVTCLTGTLAWYIKF